MQKTIVITGATSGIGLQTARILAAEGMRLVLVGHNPKRTEMAVRRLRRYVPGAEVTIHNADLSDLGEIRRLAATLCHSLPRIDVLINNAGAIFSKREVTADGLERTFALNHIAPFALTELLLERLIVSAPSRVVNVTSNVHVFATLDFDNLQYERRFGAWKAYARSKLCNVLFTRELAKRLKGAGVTVNCLHPGFNAGGFGDENQDLFWLSFWLFKRLAASTPRKGAARSAHLAISPEVEGITGCYFKGLRPASPSKLAQNDLLAERLWNESMRLAGIRYDSKYTGAITSWRSNHACCSSIFKA